MIRINRFPSCFSHSLRQAIPFSYSESGIALQFEVLLDLKLDLRLDLVLALLLPLLDAVADEEDIEHDHEKHDKQEHLASPEGVESRWHEVLHVPQRQLNVIIRVADIRAETNMVSCADGGEDFLAPQLVGVRVAIDRH